MNKFKLLDAVKYSRNKENYQITGVLEDSEFDYEITAGIEEPILVKEDELTLLNYNAYFAD